MILLVLSRLGSVRAAARTGLLSRWWCGLSSHLTDLAFPTDTSNTIEEALVRFSAAPAVSSIHIRSPVITRNPSSLLRAAALLSPAELVFVLNVNDGFRRSIQGSPLVDIVLPCFDCLTSIELDVGRLSISPPSDGEFPALEKLSLAGCILDLGTLLGRCPRLRVLGVNFRGVFDPDSLHAAFAALEAAAAALGFMLSLLGIDTRLSPVLNDAGFGPLLRAMARLSPRKLMFNHNFGGCFEAALPCFHRATSIEMDLYNIYSRHHTVCLTPLLDGEFTALERLSLSRHCSITDLGTLVSRCPRLRVLKVAVANTGDIKVHSASLQDLSVSSLSSNMECHRIDIVAPMLKQLEMSVCAGSGRKLSTCVHFDTNG